MIKSPKITHAFCCLHLKCVISAPLAILAKIYRLCKNRFLNTGFYNNNVGNHGSQWCPRTVRLQTFFQVSSFVLSGTIPFIQIWNNDRILSLIVSSAKLYKTFTQRTGFIVDPCIQMNVYFLLLIELASICSFTAYVPVFYSFFKL